MTIDPTTFAAIAAMAVATYLTRIAGYWLVRRVSLTGRPAAALEARPDASHSKMRRLRSWARTRRLAASSGWR